MIKFFASLGAVLAVCFGIAAYGLFAGSLVAPVPPPVPSPHGTVLPGSSRAAAVQDADAPEHVQPRGQSRHSPPPSVPAAGDHAQPVVRPGTVTIDNTQYPQRSYRALQLPNDPLANQPWVTNAKLDLAWEVPRGNHETLLAIIDTGFGMQHEEFADRWYENSGESGAAQTENPSILNCTARSVPVSAACNLIDENGDGIVDNETGATTQENPSRLNCTEQSRALDKSCNRIDDDNNGLVDDMTGWDFINYDNSVQAGEVNPAGVGTTHGTLVAGVAAASGNNSKGIAGADWGTRILPLQALDDDSYGNTGSVGRAIYYAVAQGADVISISLGSELPDSYVEAAVRAATAAGIVVVAAAGNDGCDCILYPARYPEVVAVGALNTSNQRAGFSSWGDSLDIMAPGTSMTSSTWTAANPTSAYASGVNGTSFAAPMVGGMLTRILSQQPHAVPLQLIAAIGENTNRLAIPASTPRDAYLGSGGLDAHKASLRMATPATSHQLYTFDPVSRGEVLRRRLAQAGAYEALGQYRVYQCSSGATGATPVYEHRKGLDSFFTVSRAESSGAEAHGYSRALLAYVCLTQPHDTYTMLRSINIYRELRNDYAKPL